MSILGDTATKTLIMLRQAYEDEAMIRRQCFEWNKRFLSRKSSLKDKERPEDLRQLTVKEMLTKLARLYTWIVADR